VSIENESNRNKIGITNIKVGNDKINVDITKKKTKTKTSKQTKQSHFTPIRFRSKPNIRL